VDEQTGAFPALLSERWRTDGCDVEKRNAGVSGYTAGQIVSDQLPEIESFQPTLITFQAGKRSILDLTSPASVPGNDVRANLESSSKARASSSA
jgi:acyl-CoA thioesterase I